MSQIQIEDVLNCPSLPSLPAVAAKLIELTGDPDVQISEIAKTVQQDQALAGKVLKTVNSSYYGLANRCGSIDRAIGYLGLNTVKSLVLGFSLVDMTSNTDHDGFDMIGHWRRTLMGATASRSLAERFGLSDKDEVFTAALFQDMGMLAIFTAIRGEYIEATRNIEHGDVSPVETTSFGFTHAAVGAGLARKWSLPENIADAIAHHHDPEGTKGGDIEMIRAVSLGTQVAEALSVQEPNTAMRRIERQTATWFPNQKIDMPGLFEEVNKSAKELASLFNTEIGDLKDVQLLMNQAQERGLEHQISMQRQTESLEKQAFTDGLTEIPNRKEFDNKIEIAYNEHMEQGTGFAVLFFDADKFKSVNDTHGHAVGDVVLIEMASRATASVGDQGVVCRYGGEEFGVILPGYTVLKAAILAERIRADIFETPFDIRQCDDGPDELNISVSIGVSAVDAGPADRLTKPEQMVSEADAGVYAAKEAGRNNVQVWSPQVVEAAGVPIQNPSTNAPKIPEGDGTIKHILLVEDDALAATLMMTLLSRSSDADVRWVQDGNQAREYLQRTVERGDRPCDLVVCDLGLPGCSGIDVFAEYKKLGLAGKIPFYILSGSDNEEMPSDVGLEGITGYISKADFAKNIGKWVKVFTQPSVAAAAA
ncbi:MAG: HDOD domain-containing protein [Phycisphaerales bacterium]|nr:HDOD domain-containing protein [Phycisphaerales bacterium]